MQRAKRSPFILIMCLLVGALGAPASTQAQEATEPDWLHLPYMQESYEGWFRIWTNENTFDKGVRKVNATSVFGNPYPGQTQEEGQGTEFQAIWLPTCAKTKAQTLTTSREIYLPGKLLDLKASLGAIAWSTPKAPPIKSIELLINNVSVYTVRAEAGKRIPSNPPDRVAADVSSESIVHGLNEFTIIAKKRETKKKAGWCSNSDRWYAVIGEVFGHVRADMGINADAPEESSSGYWLKQITITNNGPSDLPAGVSTFSVSAVSDQLKITDVATTFSASDCSDKTAYSNSGRTGYYRTCKVPHMPPGATRTFIIGIYVDEATAQVGDKVYVSLGLGGYGDNYPPSNANNSKFFELTVKQN